MSENKNIPRKTDLPYGDAKISDKGDLENLDELEFDLDGPSAYEVAKDDDNFWDKLKKTWNGKTKAGKYLGLGLDIGQSFLPGWVGRIRNTIKSKTQPKTDSDMDWIKNRLSEKSTWRGIIAVLTAVGVGFSPDQKEAIVVAGVALVGVFEAFFKEPQSQDA